MIELKSRGKVFIEDNTYFLKINDNNIYETVVTVDEDESFTSIIRLPEVVEEVVIEDDEDESL